MLCCCLCLPKQPCQMSPAGSCLPHRVSASLSSHCVLREEGECVVSAACIRHVRFAHPNWLRATSVLLITTFAVASRYAAPLLWHSREYRPFHLAYHHADPQSCRLRHKLASIGRSWRCHYCRPRPVTLPCSVKSPSIAPGSSCRSVVFAQRASANKSSDSYQRRTSPTPPAKNPRPYSLWLVSAPRSLCACLFRHSPIEAAPFA